MPVTAKLSRKFYEKLGDDITNELVNWLNQVDTTYRTELKELNDTNFARFDAKLEQRAAQLNAKIEQRFAQLDAKIEQRFGQLDAKIELVESRLNARMSAFEARIIRWMFLFWVGQAVTTVGLVFGVVRLVGR
jgi:ABC-type phosphate transport system auxiliary subunit